MAEARSRRRTTSILVLAATALAAVAPGCANYTYSTRSARDEFYSAKYLEAARMLEKGAREEGVNQLLFVLDRATALHHAGEYDESNKEFHLADKLSEIKDYTSLSAEATTLVTNDKIIPYKGEDFEKVLISQYLALNYLLLGKYEDALVECRRVNHKLHLMISQGKRKYKLNPMASYLAALLYEHEGQWNDAYVDYQAVHRLAPGLPYLGEDLYRLAWKNRIRDDMERWAAEYNLSKEDQRRIRETASQPELILIVENGKSPEKHPDPNWTAVPMYVPRNNPVAFAEVQINDRARGRSNELFSVESTAIQNLKDKYAALIAKRVAGVVAKEVVAKQVEKKVDPLVGAILRFGMYVADQADLRAWLTLPRDFQIFRVRVPEGESYNVKVVPKRADGSDAPAQIVEKLIHFELSKPGKVQRAFIPVRIL